MHAETDESKAGVMAMRGPHSLGCWLWCCSSATSILRAKQELLQQGGSTQL